MPTECDLMLFEFAPLEGRLVVAAFDGGALTSEAGACCWTRPTAR